MLFNYSFFVSIIIFIILISSYKKFREYFYKKYPNAVNHLEETIFYEQFEKYLPKDNLGKLLPDKAEERWKELLEKAWKARDFEIDLYWKRANYFWLFQVPAFAAYFTSINKSTENVVPDEIFSVCCLGIIFSTAWLCINKGSKSWQRHWEVYIDLLENKYYGPLYQTVNSDKTFSVSKINEIVSFSFIVIWGLFSIKIAVLNKYFTDVSFNISALNPIIAYSIFFTLLTIISIIFGYGRGYFKNREVKMFKRNFTYKNP